MIKRLLILIVFFISSNAFSQTKVKMTEMGGVSAIPCKVNGIELTFYFDTGAADVSLSLTEARFMYKNGFLKDEDIIDRSAYQDASGNIGVNTIINIKEIIIAGIKLKDVRASVVDKMAAPLLLGQSAIKKLGPIQLDLEQNILTILNGKPNPEDNVVVSKFKIGQKYGGGKIFYIDETGDHGLIAAEDDIKRGEIFWSDSTTITSSSFAEAVGSGKANTKKIIDKLGPGNYAAMFCKELKLNGYNDWFLPSKDELKLLYDNKEKIGNFCDCIYWSSSEISSEYAWGLRFSVGRPIQCQKNYNSNFIFGIRAVRTF